MYLAKHELYCKDYYKEISHPSKEEVSLFADCKLDLQYLVIFSIFKKTISHAEKDYIKYQNLVTELYKIVKLLIGI